MNRLWHTAGILLFMALLHGCGGGAVSRPDQDGAPTTPRDVSDVPNAVPKQEPRSRYGNPESYVVFGRRYHVMDSRHGYQERGIASWYGTKFHGKRTSSGESYNMYAMTAAHKSLPLPTYVRVRNLENGRDVVVKVNDRGPFHDNRIIDMSYAAASKLGMLDKGTALVEVKAINPGREPGGEPRYAAGADKVAAAKPAPRPEVKRVPAPDPEVAPEVTPEITKNAVGPETTDEFFIQVGAFSELQNAERIRSRLDRIENKHVRISQTVVDNQTFYRVRIGPLTDVDTADRIVSKLPDYGINTHHIVTE